jgi:hypothetical protein
MKGANENVLNDKKGEARFRRISYVQASFAILNLGVHLLVIRI